MVQLKFLPQITFNNFHMAKKNNNQKHIQNTNDKSIFINIFKFIFSYKKIC